MLLCCLPSSALIFCGKIPVETHFDSLDGVIGRIAREREIEKNTFMDEEDVKRNFADGRFSEDKIVAHIF